MSWQGKRGRYASGERVGGGGLGGVATAGSRVEGGYGGCAGVEVGVKFDPWVAEDQDRPTGFFAP